MGCPCSKKKTEDDKVSFISEDDNAIPMKPWSTSNSAQVPVLTPKTEDDGVSIISQDGNDIELDRKETESTQPQVPVTPPEKVVSKVCVAAVDFGTAYSAYAYGTKNISNEEKPYNIYVNPRTKMGLQTAVKVPTSVLLNPDKTLKSFGFEAEEEFIGDADKYKEFYFFRHFKMKLFENKSLNRDTVLKDASGKELKAVDVFSTVIRFFKDELLTYLHNRDTKSDFTENDIYWVITVPAIWDLKAKQFMREAANQAGIPDHQMTLALEPEVASIFCKRQRVGIRTSERDFSLGEKYLVLDLGGGTVDITAHEVLLDGGLRELHRACGGHWGGLRVNEEFESLISNLFGDSVRQDIIRKCPDAWLELMDEFERKKRLYKSGEHERVRITVPYMIIKTFEDTNHHSLKEVINNSTIDTNVTFEFDKLSMPISTFERFFETSIHNIVGQVKDLLKSSSLKGVSVILMVGGYAESPLLQDAIKSHFPFHRVIIPEDASLAVSKGAVVYGFEPEIISSRASRYTYGIAMQRIFNKEKDPPHKKRMVDDIEMCDDAFDIHIKIDDVIKIGQFQKEIEYEIPNPDMKEAILELFASTDRNPRFVDDKSCMMVGAVHIPIDTRTARSGGKIKIALGFDGTYIAVKATDMLTKAEINASYNFLM